jgi:transcriptional regulator with XRE-family HTH domain
MLSPKHIKIIFGLKMKELRIKSGLSFNDLSDKTGLSVSYLNEIEKFKKYPKQDKIYLLAEALESNFEFLTSNKPSKQFKPIFELLDNKIFKDLPLSLFGFEPEHFITLLSNAPKKTTAYITAFIEMANRYAMSTENLYYTVLRKYLEMNENYFEDIEKAANECRTLYDLNIENMTHKDLEHILTENYSYIIDNSKLNEFDLLKNIRSIYKKEKNKLFLNKNLHSLQLKFLYGRELGFKILNCNIRPITTPVLEIQSFEEVLNNYKASYFSIALLLPENILIEQTKVFLKQPKWENKYVIELLERLNSTPEMLFQRWTNILPKHFNINTLFFLRFEHDTISNQFKLNKELHLNGQHFAQAKYNSENYCRRWIAIKSLNTFQHELNKKNQINISIQKSKNVTTKLEYLSISVAKPNYVFPHKNVSVTLGLAIDNDMRKHIKFLDDENIPTIEVGQTCETCAILNCAERIAENTVSLNLIKNKSIQNAIEQLQ